MHRMRSLDSDEFNGLTVAADWITDLESSDSRLHKEAVVEKALVAARLGSSNAQCFLYNCYLAYNPFYIYNVRQVPETADLKCQPNPWPEFWGMLEALRTRSLTGHRARDRIAELSQLFDSDEWNMLCRRVIIKDLKCGISEKTLNRVLKNSEWAIPVFSCQLAKDSTERINSLTGLNRLEVKLDGVRMLAVSQAAGSVNIFSRNGKPLSNFPHVQDAVCELSNAISSQAFGKKVPFVLDGEVVGKSFQELMRQTHRKSGAKTEDSVFYIFDIIPRENFFGGHWNTPQDRRLELLEKIRSVLPENSPLKIMPGIVVDNDTAEGRECMQKFAEESVDQGYEGIMIKRLQAPYECRRNDFWLKWKPFIEVTLEIVDVEEGTGRNKGRLGAVVCAGQDDGKDIRVNVGSGFSDDQRSSFWTDRNDLVGHMVEVRADAVTQNQDGTYSLRFPRFKTFRGFEPGEKL